MDYIAQIQHLRDLVTKIEGDLANFGRKAEDRHIGVVTGPAGSTARGQLHLSKMIRYAEEQRFNAILARLEKLSEGINQLDDMVEDEIEDRIAELEEEDDDDDEA